MQIQKWTRKMTLLIKIEIVYVKSCLNNDSELSYYQFLRAKENDV